MDFAEFEGLLSIPSLHMNKQNDVLADAPLKQTQIHTKLLGHPGLVSATIQELGIVNPHFAAH